MEATNTPSKLSVSFFSVVYNFFVNKDQTLRWEVLSVLYVNNRCINAYGTRGDGRFDKIIKIVDIIVVIKVPNDVQGVTLQFLTPVVILQELNEIRIVLSDELG